LFWGCVLGAVCGIALVGVASFLAARFGRHDEDRKPDGVSGGQAANMIRAFFLMAFAIGLILPFTRTDSARQNTYAEAQSLVEAYWNANRLPADQADLVHSGLRDYTTFVINQEWPVLAGGQLSQQGWTMLDDLRSHVMSLSYTQKPASDGLAAVLTNLSNVYAARRQRAVDAAASVPQALVAFAIATGFLVILFPFLAGVRPLGRAVLPLLITAGLVGAGMFLVVDDQHIFSGGIPVQPQAFRSALTEMQRIA
jgi:hypothetical protein